MKRKPTEPELEKIRQAVAAGDRIEATSLYMSIAGCGLSEAQMFIASITMEVHSSNQEKSARKQPKRRIFGIFKSADQR